MLNHSVKNSEQFPHAGGNSRFLCFTGSNQSLIERLITGLNLVATNAPI